MVSLNKSALTLFAALALSSCSTLLSNGVDKSLVSENKNERVRFLVMHYTAIDWEKSAKVLTKEPYGVSSHYLIPEHNDDSYPKRKLKVHQLVDEKDRAWHAGVSHWQGREGLNDQSIGIEIVHVPVCHQPPEIEDKAGNKKLIAEKQLCIFPDYDAEQIELLIDLSKDILARYPEITPTRVIGHSDIAPGRKTDPGPRFPWQQLYKAGIGAWYEDETVNKYWQMFLQKPPSISLVQQALSDYGYGVTKTGVLDKATVDVIKSFQLHFRAWDVSGEANDETVATLFAFLDRYFPKKAERLLEQYQQQQPVDPHLKNIPQGQIDQQFDSSDIAVGFADRFVSFTGKDPIRIDNNTAERVELSINGDKHVYSLTNGQALAIVKPVKKGMNTLAVVAVEPADANFRLTVPFPVIEGVQQAKNVDSKRFSGLDTWITQQVQQGFPGLGLLVIHKGKVIKREVYGCALCFDSEGNVLTKQPVQYDTMFDLASNTKMYATNYALMRLVAENRLDVNQPIRGYLPEYKGQGREALKVRDLLHHIAGYPASIDFYRQPAESGLFSQQRQRTVELLLSRVGFETALAERTRYSDIDYMLLGVLVERIVGEPLDAYVESTFYEPLGLRYTKFNPLLKGFDKERFAATELQGNSRSSTIDFANIRTDVIRGEVHDEKAFYSMAGVSGHAGLFSTIDELGVLASAMLFGGGVGNVGLFTDDVIEQFTAPSPYDSSFGLGWRRASTGKASWLFGDYASERAFGHTGWTGTLTVIDPEHDLVIVALSNRKHSPIISSDKGVAFTGDQFELARYGNLVNKIYQAVL